MEVTQLSPKNYAECNENNNSTDYYYYYSSISTTDTTTTTRHTHRLTRYRTISLIERDARMQTCWKKKMKKYLTSNRILN